MLTTQNNRIDPSLIDSKELDRLAAMFSQEGHVTILDKDGERTELPEHIYDHLMRIVRLMHEGKAVVMLPEDETFTTQAAANHLGVSRQFFVNLLEEGKIPFHKVGSHRRVNFKDLLKFQTQRDEARRVGMDALNRKIDEVGLYFDDGSKSEA